jgi:hypothetical protein
MLTRHASTSHVSGHHITLDIYSVVEVAQLIRELGAEIELAAHDETLRGAGQRTEFCIGGPFANSRMATHMKRYLPGIYFVPYSNNFDSLSIVARGQRFLYERGEKEYAILAKVIPYGDGRPIFLFSGQTSTSNRAAVAYLKNNYRKLSQSFSPMKRFCLVLRVVSPKVYGHNLIEIAADLSSIAFNCHAV